MKLDPSATIPSAKISKYLLIRRPEDDKSGYLALAGNRADDPERLEADLRALLNREAEFQKTTKFGTTYRIRGVLVGPNSRSLTVITVWLVNTAGTTHFVTLYPDKEVPEWPSNFTHASP